MHISNSRWMLTIFFHFHWFGKTSRSFLVPDVRVEVVGAVDDEAHHLVLPSVPEGHVAAQHGVQHHSARPHVHLEAVPLERGRGIVQATLQDLRTQVARGAAHLLQPPARHDLLAEAEVGELDVEVLVEEDVLRLDVSVDDAEVVAVLQCAEQLRHDGPGLALGERHDAGEKVEELPVRAELEDEEDYGVTDENVVQPYYVLVAIHVLQDHCLAKELTGMGFNEICLPHLGYVGL